MVKILNESIDIGLSAVLRNASRLLKIKPKLIPNNKVTIGNKKTKILRSNFSSESFIRFKALSMLKTPK